MKFCKSCDRTMPVAEFYAKLEKASPKCKACTAIYRRSRIYGIPFDEARLMLSAGSCQCCGVPFTKKSHQYMDHCHGTGRVRGVVCQRCNTALGCVDDDPGRLRLLIAYLERL